MDNLETKFMKTFDECWCLVAGALSDKGEKKGENGVSTQRFKYLIAASDNNQSPYIN